MSRAEFAARRIVDAFHAGRRARPLAPGQSDEFVPLADAARTLQSALRGSDLDCLSRGLSESDEALLAFWAHRVARIGIPVHGRRIMSTRLETISEHEMLSGRLVNQATRLEPRRNQPLRDVCALQVRRSDLDAWLSRSEQAEAA